MYCNVWVIKKKKRNGGKNLNEANPMLWEADVSTLDTFAGTAWPKKN